MKLPKTLGGPVERSNIRLPKPMMDEVDEFVKRHPELYVNRQQFIEGAIRDKLTYFRELKL